MSDTAERFQRASGKVVTYEDPILTWASDFAPPGHKAFGKNAKGMNPKERSFWLSTTTASESDSNVALEQAIDSYNRESDGPRFRVLTSKLGRHVVPAEVRNAAGVWTKARNPLDQMVNISKQTRRVGEHLQALLDAVERTNQIKYVFMPIWIRPDSLEVLYGSKGAFAWGTDGAVVAREALIDLLSASHTTFYWNAHCDTTVGKPDVSCWIVISDLLLPTRQPDGKVSYREVQFDRVSKQ
jgi:hypothetical protein